MTSLIELTIIFGAALLPAVVWLWFFLKEDIHPEPKRLIFATFLLGVFITLPVLLTQIHYQDFMSNYGIAAIFSVLGLALIEELFKFFAAFASVHNDSRFDEPVDAMIYSIAAALGFATVENIFVALNTVDTINSFSFMAVAESVLLRFIGATLLHALASSVVGYFWARGIIQRKLVSRVAYGIILATLVHAAFNYLILRYQEENLFYPSLFLVFAAFFVLSDFEKLRNLPQISKASISS